MYPPHPDTKVYDHLLKLKKSFGPDCDRRVRAVVLIGACIEHGFDTRYDILMGTRVAGLSKDHVLAILDEQTGTVPGIHLWECAEGGHYRLLDTA